MNNDTKNNFLKQGFFFPSTVSSRFQFILDVANDLVEKKPQILNWIREDQDKVSKEKKQQRIQDRHFKENQTKSLIPEEQLNEIIESVGEEEPTLKTGRSRMKPEVVFLFFIFRGYFGSFTKQQNLDLLKESITIRNWLVQHGVDELPGATTILENVNMISNETREKILTLQCEIVSDDNLDDFNESYIDSTSVAGNTAYPTDITILFKLLWRCFVNFTKICKMFSAPISEGYFEGWFNQMKGCIFSLIMGKLKTKQKKKVCKKLLKLAGNLQNRLSKIIENKDVELQLSFAKIEPARRKKLEIIWAEIKTDLEDALRVLGYAYKSLIEEKKYKSTEKILSISDETVAYIIKGSLRSAVIGYKPQVVRSGNGIITAILFPHGNTSDMKELIPVLKQAFRRTGVISKTVSTDDGYSWDWNQKWLKRINVETISFNGVKGRNLISTEDWESEAYKVARNERSSIEGLFSTMKLVQDFGKLSRRGLENGHAEVLEKVIVQNFYRIGVLRKRREESEQRKEDKRKIIIQTSSCRVEMMPRRQKEEKVAA